MNKKFLNFGELNSELKKVLEGVWARKSCSFFGATESLKVMLSAAFDKTLVYVTSDIVHARKIQEMFESVFSEKVVLFPAVADNLIYKRAVSADSFLERNRTLALILNGSAKIVIVPTEALLMPLAPVEFFEKSIIRISKGQTIERSDFVKSLNDAGYKRVDLVSDPGDFAVRGDLVDLYDAGSMKAYRIDFFDDEVERISELDPETTKSAGDLEEISICPDTMIFSDDFEEIIEKLEGMKSRKFDSAEVQNDFVENLNEIISRLEMGDRSHAMEVILPLLYEKPKSLFDYVKAAHGENAIICFDEAKMVFDSLTGIEKEYVARIANLAKSKNLIDEKCYNSFEMLQKSFESFTCVAFQKITSANNLFSPDFVAQVKSNPALRYSHSHSEFAKTVRSLVFHEHKVFIFAGNMENAKGLKQTLENHDCYIDIKEEARISDFESAIIPECFPSGMSMPSERIMVFGTYDLYAKKTQEKKYSASRKNVFSVPKVGDYVVHSFHGIGVCEGVSKLDGNFGTKDYVVVRYRDGDKLFVPIDQMNMLEKFSGGETPSKLSKIGGAEFARVKAKVKEGVRKIAFNLLSLYAEREKLRGYAFPQDDMLQIEFENSFPHTETEDQLISLSEIKKDMESSKVMDRLLCGDVGFGKTEVALRAAFKAVIAGKQVAFIAPTTILSEQHFNTASNRTKEFGVNVEVLNRFKKPKEVKEILKKLEEGKIDIICGTHRLLSKDVKFKDLGLIILDEEQKFGVEDKEKLKVNHKNVDVLTLSATPIPRTLHMSLSGIRDVSIISTPPSVRLPIETSVTEESDALIADAITREMKRSGQVYILFNNVERIYAFAQKIREIAPEARVVVAHGQMSGKELENVIYSFYRGEADVLVCTTIIENGIDIENANTLVIVDSDKFGLSQLYQIRGRVGRGSRLAYAYFTYNRDKVLTNDAYKRLEAISEFTEFGSGFKLAMKDLEIRGGGNIFGAEQHGHMQKVGYDMYAKLLSEAVSELKGAKQKPKSQTTVRLAIDAFIPENYILKSEDRMTAYKNIGTISGFDSFEDVKNSLEASFGCIPKPTENLLKISYLRALGSNARVKEIVSDDGSIKLVFEDDEKIVGNEKIGEAIYAFRARCVLDLSHGEVIKFSKLGSIQENIEEIIKFLELLDGDDE